MNLVLFLLLTASTLHFDITDARGKRAAGGPMDAGSPDADGWYGLRVAAKTAGKSKTEPVLVWPFDGRAKAPDGPGAIPVIVIQSGDERVLGNTRVAAAIAAGCGREPGHAR